jgi:glycosyltransferase involved in cell wall biosynthesis
MHASDISVVIGAYNAARWIRATLDSVLAQSLPPMEVVVVDDGSTDDTTSIVAGFGAPVRCIREAHRGRPHRNRGIQETSGRWIAFIDADDLWHGKKLELQGERLEQTGCAWAICDSDWITPENEVLPGWAGMTPREGDILVPLFLNNFIAASTVIVRRDVLGAAGYFDETSQVAAVEDWDLWLRIAARFPVACVPSRLTAIRLHSDSYLAALDIADRVRHQEAVVERAFSVEPARLGTWHAQALSNVRYSAGVRLFREGHSNRARQCFAAAIRKTPTRLEAIGYLLLSLAPGPLARALVRYSRGMRVSPQNNQDSGDHAEKTEPSWVASVSSDRAGDGNQANSE